MAAKKFSHHFVPHHHPETDEAHRAHALNSGALFGYLIIFFVTIAGFYFIRTTAPQILGTAKYSAEQIIELTNIKRAESGLSPLVFNSLLSRAAQAKAFDMFSNNYWAHYSPQGKKPWDFIASVGYRYIYAGENLARDFNDPESVVNAWMASPSHRSNLLDKNFGEIGVAVESGDLTGREGVLVVQLFGSSISQAPTSEPLAQAPAASESTQGEITEAESIPTGEITQIDKLNSETVDQGATVLASRQFSIAKIISLVLVGFVFMLFLIEVAVASKKTHIDIKSSTLAHLGILGLVLFAVWYAVQGAVI